MLWLEGKVVVRGGKMVKCRIKCNALDLFEKREEEVFH